MDVSDLHEITGNTKHAARKAAFIDLITEHAGEHLAPHRMAQLLAQVCEESSSFRYVREIWGPSRAQRRYEGRKDLGNVIKGDGKRYMGRDLMQITGRSNYRALTAWVNDRFPGKFPDFEKAPAKLEANLGIGVLWYWTTRVPMKYIDAGDIEMVTRRVNGGLNGYDRRLKYYDRTALVLLGFAPSDIKGFQIEYGLKADGISGPKTRSKMHLQLKELHAHKESGMVSAILAIITALFGGKK